MKKKNNLLKENTQRRGIGEKGLKTFQKISNSTINKQ